MGLRLTPEELTELTTLTRPQAQGKWFHDMFGVFPPCDRRGPIVTASVVEKLLAKRYGVDKVPDPDLDRPQVKMVRKIRL